MNSPFPLIDLVRISPLLALLVASLIPITLKILNGNQERDPFVTLIYSYIGILAAAGLSVTFLLTEAGVAQPTLAFNGALIFDGLSGWTSLVVLLVSAFSILLSKENKAIVGHQFSEYIFLILNATIGMLVVSWSNDLIVTFIAIELMSLCVYIMIAMSHEERLSKEASFKYFVLGSFGSAILLYGISLLYGVMGTTHLDAIFNGAAQFTSNPLFMVGVALILSGFLFKVSIVPFHAWTPDVYTGSPTPVTGFMATGIKVVSFVALLRFFTSNVVGSGYSEGLITILEWLAVLTMSLGNFAALKQTNFKRMLAYSSVAHSGYALIGLLISGMTEGGLGAVGLIFYIFGYSVMTIGAFGVIGLLEEKADSVVHISDLKGLHRRSPWTAFFLMIFLLSLAGIPPTVGFFGKFFIFTAAMQQGLYWLAIWGVINSVVSVYYYLKPVVNMYMVEPEGQKLGPLHKDIGHFAIGFAATLVLVIGVFADPFYSFIFKTLHTLFKIPG